MGDLQVTNSEEGVKEVVEDGWLKEVQQQQQKTNMREERESGVVRWEEYLPKMVIRVLLVEADDSTRHIIAALLRKCNYKVAAIPDGLKAWEILKRKHSNIDLILTEVDLPSISGYALLTLIMEHDGCKNIPVIMMSSCDSISMVFKCMLKGAADFLIKPVRRNELKNLWQHVWRRTSNNNEQGQQNSQSNPCKIESTCKSEKAVNHSDDDVSSSLNKDQSYEKARDTQSSGTSHDLNTESAEIQNVQNFSESAPKQTDLSRVSHGEIPWHNIGMKTRKGITLLKNEREAMLEVDISNVVRDSQDEPESCATVSHGSDGKKQHCARDAVGVVDLIGRINDNCDHDSSYQLISYGEMNGGTINAPELELSLTRAEDVIDQAKKAKKQRLNHSNASAFSWYSNNKLGTLLSSSESISSTKIKGESKMNKKASPAEDDGRTYPWSVNARSGKEESEKTHVVSSTSQDVDLGYSSVPQLGFLPLPGAGFGPIFPHMLGSQTTQQIGVSSKAEQQTNESSSRLTSPSLHSDVRSYGLTVGQSGLDETSNQERHDNTAVSVDEHQRYGGNCGGGPCQSATTGISTRCSGGSDGLINKSSRRATAEDEHVYDNGTTTSSDVLMHENELSRRGKGGVSVFSTQREAALARFRQKRKDRCFEKKVRYQSRKKLAEQRPRVKGQFVRQVLSDHSISDIDDGNKDDGG